MWLTYMGVSACSLQPGAHFKSACKVPYDPACDIKINAGETNYDYALLAAKRGKKPLLIYFTSSGCDECRGLEDDLVRSPYPLPRLKRRYSLVVLDTGSANSLENSKEQDNPDPVELSWKLRTLLQQNYTGSDHHQPLYWLILLS